MLPSRRTLALVPALVALLLALAPGAQASTLAVTGDGIAQFNARGSAVLFSTMVRPRRTGTLLVLPRGVRPACVIGTRPCVRRVPGITPRGVRWRVLRPVSFLVPSRLQSPFVRIAGARTLELSVTGCGVLLLNGIGTYSVNGVEQEYAGRTVVRVRCERQQTPPAA